MSIQRVLIALEFTAALFFVSGCGRGDCDYVCSRWDECVPGGIQEGVDACVDQCIAKADHDAVYRGRVEECRQCAVDAKSCGKAETDCAIDCLISVAH